MLYNVFRLTKNKKGKAYLDVEFVDFGGSDMTLKAHESKISVFQIENI